MLPQKLILPLKIQIEKVKLQHKQDLEDGYGSVYLPYALAKKYPNAEKEFGWLCISRALYFHRPQKRKKTAPPSLPIYPAKRDKKKRKKNRYTKSGHTPHSAPLLCHPSVAEWLWYQNGTGITWAQRCQNNHDLHPCTKSRRTGRQKPSWLIIVYCNINSQSSIDNIQ